MGSVANGSMRAKMVKEPRNDDQLRRVEQLLCEDAENYLKELDDPQQHRRRFERIVDRLEREGFAEPSAPEEEGAIPPPPPPPPQKKNAGNSP